MVGSEVLGCLDRVRGTGGLCWWVHEFVSQREFEVSWDGSVRGSGRSMMGVPQGSPLSRPSFGVDGPDPGRNGASRAWEGTGG